MARPAEFMEECHRRYGDCFTLNTLLFGVEVVVVDPEVIKRVFTGDPDVYRAGEANVALGPVVGRRSVLLLDGPEHIRHRRLLLPPFHGERMLAYEGTMREVTEAAIARFPVGRPFALHPFMQAITLDVILRTVFGLGEGAPSDDLRAALPRVLDRMQNPLAAFVLAPAFQRSFHGLSPWDAFLRDMARADGLVHAQIARRRESTRGPRTDVLAMLLEARDEEGKPLTDAELRDELMTLLVAGHETTATMLCWAMDFILHDGRVRARLEDEFADVRVQPRRAPAGSGARDGAPVEPDQQAAGERERQRDALEVPVRDQVVRPLDRGDAVQVGRLAAPRDRGAAGLVVDGERVQAQHAAEELESADVAADAGRRPHRRPVAERHRIEQRARRVEHGLALAVAKEVVARLQGHRGMIRRGRACRNRRAPRRPRRARHAQGY